MSVLKPLLYRREWIRCMSDIVSSKNSTKFVVSNGQFVRMPKITTDVHEELTHTGQMYAEHDPRRARFIDRKKLVTKKWAINMVAEEPPTEVEGRKAVCDGRDGVDGAHELGHPRVYMNLDNGEVKSCMYCGSRYVKKK